MEERPRSPKQIPEMPLSSLENLLGPDPTKTSRIELRVNEEVAKRLKAWLSKGIGETDLDFLIQQYIIPGFLHIPKLNPEIEAYLQKNAKDRDAHLADGQTLTAVALASLCGNFIVLLDESTVIDQVTRDALVSMTKESAMLQAHSFYESTLTRRSFVLRSIRSGEVRELLEKQEVDDFLFGRDLGEKLKKLKALEKVSKLIGNNQDSQNRISAKSFLAQRNAHPHRQNKPWAGQGSQRDRWSLNPRQHQRPYDNNNRPQNKQGNSNFKNKQRKQN